MMMICLKVNNLIFQVRRSPKATKSSYAYRGVNRREMYRKFDIFNVDYGSVNTGDYLKPYWDFSYIVVLRGVGISNDPNYLCSTPPLIIKSVNTGGSNGYIN